MATGLKTWSTTPATNATFDGGAGTWSEGQAPSTVNNSARQMMADLRSWFETPPWIDYGDTPTQTAATTFTVPGDQTANYTVGRAIRATDTTTFYGFITASAYTSLTTVTVAAATSLSASLSAVALGAALNSNHAWPRDLLFGNIAVATTTGTATAYVAAPSPPLPSLFTGARIRIKLNVATGTAPTLAVSGLTAKNMTKNGGTAIALNDGAIAQEMDFIYDGTNWEAVGIVTSAGTAGITWTLVTADPANATARSGYMANTAGGAFSITLPTSPVGGDEIAFSDGTGTWATNNLTIARNGNTIMGSATNLTCAVKNASFRLVYNATATDWRFA